MKLIHTPLDKGGLRIFGRDGVPYLLVQGAYVINGNWRLHWADDDQLEGYCHSRSHSSHYMGHVAETESRDYTDILAHAETILNDPVQRTVLRNLSPAAFKQPKHPNMKKAFTLIELLIVVSIIAIIVTGIISSCHGK